MRETFLGFFEEREHLIRPSVPLLSPDPTTLFTSAGMQPYMDAFCGHAAPPAPRVASCQKCARTSDIELIGRTARHESFFEMLGNFSFGDYFKEGAIDLAWELFVDVLGLPKDDLWITVYEDDDEAADIWHTRIGVPREKIGRLGRGDNWWPKERWDGPCGPCSEIHIDRGPSFACDNPDCKPGCDGNELCDRYLELWNLVFPMYTESEDGELSPLPAPGIDTGLGLERIAMVMQPGARNVFETDEMAPILKYLFQLADESGQAEVQYGSDAAVDTAARIITDHTRAAGFLIADGVMPSNEGAGYVLRRFIRRAYCHGRRLGLGEPFIHKVVPLLGRTMGRAYPELKSREDFAVRVIKGEEERFGQTLDRGIELLQDVLDRVERSDERQIPGRDAFELYATYGFPLEMTQELAAERGIEVDEAGFQAAMDEHAAMSTSMAGLRDHGEVSAALELPATTFVGYET
ncbi:MAG: alanine--tRNA ligase, partial [Armatimonadota bacterium]